MIPETTPLTPKAQRILSTASELIVRYTYDKTTMGDIARAAGISKSALYLIWPGKQQLFEALLAYEMKRLLEDFAHRVEADPAAGEVAHLFKHALLALQANPLMCALYTRDAEVLGDFVRYGQPQRYREALALNVDLIREMQRAGLIQTAIRPEVLSYLFSLIAVGFLNMQSLVPPAETPPLEAVTEALIQMLQQGLTMPGGNSAAGKQAVVTSTAQAIQHYEEQLAKTTR